MGNKEEIFKKHFELVSGKKADDMVVSRMKYVQDAMQEYSDQQNKDLIDKVKEKDSEILKLKQSNDRYNQDYSECQLLLKEQLLKTVKHKARVDELEKAKEDSEAVEFAEWLQINTYGFVRGMGWLEYYGSKEFKSTTQLYEIFKTKTALDELKKSE